MDKEHIEKDKSAFKCFTCDYKSDDVKSLWTHQLNNHEDNQAHSSAQQSPDTISNMFFMQQLHVLERIGNLESRSKI